MGLSMDIKLLAQGMLVILPNKNLVSNIGFNVDATHAHGKSVCSNIIIEQMRFPLQHPEFITPHYEADSFTSKGMFMASFLGCAIQKIRSFIH